MARKREGRRDGKRGGFGSEARRGKIYVYGRHALREALAHAPRAVRKVFLAPPLAEDRELARLLERERIPAEIMRGGREASRMVGEDAAHQGVIAVVDPEKLVVDFDEFFSRELEARISSDTLFVLLDELTDPHNVGAIIRSAAAFGADGVLIPPHNQAPITGSVVKASAGMAFRIPLLAIGNVNRTVDVLKDAGFRVYGLLMNGDTELADEPFSGPSLIIVGNEASGIREKTLARCDAKLRIPMHPRAESLNASVSAAVALYSWSAKHPAALKSGAGPEDAPPREAPPAPPEKKYHGI